MDEEITEDEAGEAVRILFAIPDRPIHFNRYGEPICMADWIAEYENRVLRQDWAGGHKISTICTGLDMEPLAGVPYIFETMVFGLDGQPCGTARYPTLAEAHVGHVEALALVLHADGLGWSDIWMTYDSRPALTAARK